MKRTRWKAVLADTLRRHRDAMLLCILPLITEAVICRLYGIPAEPVLYSAILIIVIGTWLFAGAFFRELERAEKRENAMRSVNSALSLLPDPVTLADADHQVLIRSLCRDMSLAAEGARTEKQDMLDYYTAWVHQIKTPIAVMKLQLEDTPEHRAMAAELFRIEQYVDMVLQYIRLGSDSTDLVIRPGRLDDMVREVIRKYAPQFVMQRIRLDLQTAPITIMTDKKWFQCILEQLISNALKYTPSGCVTIKTDEAGRLMISDTGIGIAAEDLPRIFEKGYTGKNGRIGKSSSGLGLYLAARAARLLSIPLSVESTVGRGSTFTLDLRQNRAPGD